MDLDDDERARVAPFVEDVVDEPCVTPHRLPQARGVEVRLGRDRVLVVAQLVADVREQLDQRDPEIGDVPLPPVGDEQREAIEQEAAEGRVVLGEIVDGRLVAERPEDTRGWACSRGCSDTLP